MINNYKPIWREEEVFFFNEFNYTGYDELCEIPHCPCCNHEVKEGSILCSNCGVLLDWSD